MKSILLSRNRIAIVDDEDYEYLSKFSWHLSRRGYAFASIRIGWRRTSVQMHRLIMDTPPELECDHINGDPLDNRRANLRNCTLAQNRANRGINKKKKYPYKGVQLISGKWCAYLKHEGKLLYLGGYDTPEEAARVWDAKARELRGEYARTNF